MIHRPFMHSHTQDCPFRADILTRFPDDAADISDAPLGSMKRRLGALKIHGKLTKSERVKYLATEGCPHAPDL